MGQDLSIDMSLYVKIIATDPYLENKTAGKECNTCERAEVVQWEKDGPISSTVVP